ncbi:CD209 antigen-like protein D [Mercenaria mercenaria]|uniref:CD209 antigen-like protein D n=1 Tax=Mercenaria mercenaria TaxID=6596 RepID=UPI00234E78BF|nr:CD209 antigen-like protein D [Mercenaria mercenaria]
MEVVRYFAIYMLYFIGYVKGSPRGFDKVFNGSSPSYYFFSHDLETWTGALLSCQILGGYLVEINSQKEYMFVKEASRATEGVSRWIGLSNKRQMDVWEWATSHEVYNETIFNMWATGEPDHFNGQKDESCVLLDKFEGDGKTHNFELADVMCDRREKYICEYNPPQIPKLAIGK